MSWPITTKKAALVIQRPASCSTPVATLTSVNGPASNPDAIATARAGPEPNRAAANTIGM